eukprot:SAG11_NODE_7328_length_1160_cov_1.197926_2_plen_183_part_01
MNPTAEAFEIHEIRVTNDFSTGTHDSEKCRAVWCSSEPCQNNGVCSEGDSGYDCECADGFTGDSCQTDINECASSPCENDAVCAESSTTDTVLPDLYTCTCEAGYEHGDDADHCQVDIDECLSSPCQNGGTCSTSSDAPDAHTCDCVAGTSGDTCEIDADECESDPCLNDGTCADSSGDDSVS